MVLELMLQPLDPKIFGDNNKTRIVCQLDVADMVFELIPQSFHPNICDDDDGVISRW